MTANQSVPLELGTEKIGKLLMKYAGPAIIAMTASSLYNMIDSIFIGHGVGPLAIAGLAVTFPLMNLSAAFGTLVGVGASTILSVLLGQKNYDVANKVLGNVVTLNIIIGLVFMSVALTFLDPILYFFGASENTIVYAREYMQVILLGNVITHLYLGLNNQLRASGNPRMAMNLTIMTVILNVIFAPLFIFVFDMGAAGAAIATVISQMISGIYVVAFLSSRHSTMRLDIRKPVIRKKILLPIISLGVSPFIMSATEAAINIAFNTRLQSLGGDMAVGTMTIFSSILTFINMPITGMNQAITPLVSYNFGAALNERVRSIYRFAAAVELSYTLLASLLCNILPGIVIGLFTTDEALISYAIPYMKFFITGMSVFGLQCSAQNTFLGLGQARISLFLAIFRKIILLIPLVYILSATPLGITGVFLAESISDATAATVTSAVFLATLPGILRKGAPKP